MTHFYQKLTVCYIHTSCFESPRHTEREVERITTSYMCGGIFPAKPYEEDFLLKAKVSLQERELCILKGKWIHSDTQGYSILLGQE